MEADLKPKIKKRKYSRRGCKECKRRKIKCDEGNPSCYNCSRLNKICVYESKLQFKDASTANDSYSPGVLIVPRPENELTLHMQFYNPNDATKNGIKQEDGSVPKENALSQKPAPVMLRDNSLDSANHSSYNHSSYPTMSLNGSVDGEQRPNLGSTGSFIIAASTHTSTSSQLPHPGLDAMNPMDLNSVDMRNLFNEASGLVHDINHLLDPGMVEGWSGNITPISSAGHLLNETTVYPLGTNNSPASLNSEEKLHFHIDEFSSRIHADSYVSPSGIAECIVLSNTELIQQCITENSLEQPHVKYLMTLTNTDLSYHIYPFASLIDSNEVMKLLLIYLAKCPYLLTSLLAISATFQFNQTGKQAHDNARQKYITVCFKSLNDAFTEHSGFENAEMLTSNIEKLLLTVLILTSYFTATNFILDENILTSWKAHLRGARDLLLHYGKVTRSSYKSEHFMSGGLALAKCWFFAIESAASIHSSFGGSLTKSKGATTTDLDKDNEIFNPPHMLLDNESLIYWESGVCDMEVNPEYHAALQRVHMLCSSPSSSEFNLYWGFTSRAVKTILLFSTIMDKVRSNGYSRVPLRWIAHLFKLTDECAQEIIVPNVILRNFEVPLSSCGHPDYTGAGAILFPLSCFVEDRTESGEKIVYSWFDLSHQIHVDNLFMKLMVQEAFLNLPRNHYHVQEMIKKLFGYFFFIKKKLSANYAEEKDKIIVESDNYYLSHPTFDNRCIMIQSIFRTLSTLVVSDDEFEKIELFFMGLVKLGNGSSLSTLDMVARFKESRRRKKAETDNDGQNDDEIYDYEDLCDIPFA